MSKIDEEAFKMPYIIFKHYKLPSRAVSYNKSFWLKKKKYFFKFTPNSYKRNDTGFIVGELFVKALCDKLGIPCVDYRYAINRHLTYEQRGVLSKSFLNDGEKDIMLRTIDEMRVFSQLPEDFMFKVEILYTQMEPMKKFFDRKDVNHMMLVLLDKKNPRRARLLPFEKSFIDKNRGALEAIEQVTRMKPNITTNWCIRNICSFLKSNNLTMEDDLRFRLQQIAILDAITKQHDRHSGNISIIYDEKTHKARIAPNYDNGLCGPFFSKEDFKYPQETLCYLKLTPRDYFDLANPSTAIGKFYEQVKSLTKADFLEIGQGITKACSNTDLARSKLLTQKYGALDERGQDDEAWMQTYKNYVEGIKMLDREIEKYKQDSSYEKGDSYIKIF